MKHKTIDELVDEVIGREGGYSNHPADRGGATRWGVTEATARAHGYAGSMIDYPRELAVEVYRDTYWELPRFDQVALRYPTLASELFDTAVNAGPGRAAGFLQRALNVLNQRGTIYGDIAVDSLIGRGTLTALDNYRQRRGAEGELVLIKAVEGLQAYHYLQLAEKDAAQEAFVYGWLANRIGQWQ